MKLLLENSMEVANGVWLTFAAPHQLTIFAQPTLTRGRRSVVLTSSPAFDKDRGSLVLDAESLFVLNIGTSPSTVVVDTIVSAEALDRDSDLLMPNDFGPGDREFLSLAERELRGEAQEAAVDLIREVRKRWAGDLKRGERNNFSNTPDNFWYVIVQPRVQALSVTVRGARSRFQSAALELRVDRPGYTRFSVKTPDEIPEALRLIAESKRKRV